MAKKKKQEQERLRYKGRYISKEFDDLIRAAAKSSNKTPNELLTNPKYEPLIDNLLETNKETRYLRPSSILKVLEKEEKSSVEVFLGEEKKIYSVERLTEEFAHMERTIRRNDNEVVVVMPKIIRWLNGKVQIFLPSKKGKNYKTEDIEEYMDSSEVEIIASR
jgi:hypothetical protein